MTMSKKSETVLVILLSILVLGAATAVAEVSTEEAQKLKGELTAIGAEKAGNAEGTIPAWTGEGVEVPAGWGGDGSHLPDPFPEDKPLFVITAQNMDQYADKLTDGQKGLFKTFADTFNMPVYKTRRVAIYPDWLVENTFKAATTVVLEEGGNGVIGAKAAIPFPIPQNGTEAVWNHLLRYRGVFMKVNKPQFVPDAAGRYVEDNVLFENYFPYYDADSPNEKMLGLMRVLQTKPARVAGDTYLINDSMNPYKNPRNAWRYFAGQRRVRRAPVLAYDTPIPPSKGIRTFDSHDLFYGSPDRYEWTLVGKKEIYIPYNAYRLGNPDLKLSDVLHKGHVNPEHTRYELHRVWVVEGKLKEGNRHIYPRRVMYLDEDSWSAVIADMYDERGNIWRIAMGHLVLFWDVPTMFYQTEVHHDLTSRLYNATSILNNSPKGFAFKMPKPGLAHFSPSALRRSGVR
jgi:hypothetical protein